MCIPPRLEVPSEVPITPWAVTVSQFGPEVDGDGEEHVRAQVHRLLLHEESGGHDRSSEIPPDP